MVGVVSSMIGLLIALILNDVSFVWPRLGNPSGMAYVRSEVRHSDVTDGTTNVIYCGEKWAERTGFADRGYDQPWSTGDSQESRRFTAPTQ